MESSTSSQLTLDQLKQGEQGIVQGVSAVNQRLQQKLLAMGIVVGTLVEITAVAPLGDPIQIRALGSRLALRLSEASQIAICPQHDPA